MIKVVNYRQFIQFLRNEGTQELLDNGYVKDLIKCMESEDRACCSKRAAITKNCNHMLISIINEALANDESLHSQLADMFGESGACFELEGKTVKLKC